jgi:hypothetical protein
MSNRGNRRETFGRVTPSKLRRSAVIAVDGVLVVGTGAIGGLFATGTASAAAPVSGWTGLQSPLPSGPDAPLTNPQVSLFAESCSSAVNCVAAGAYNGANRGLLDTLSGGSWSASEPALPSDAIADPPSIMTGVSCPSDGWCVADGIYQTAPHGVGVVIETLSGGQWSEMKAPLPSDVATGSGEAEFSKSPDCIGVGSCLLVGSYKNGAGHRVGFIDMLTGGHWSTQIAPQPAGAATKNSVTLNSVSCPALGPCSAVGSYQNASSNTQAEILQQASDGSWTAVDAPLPATNAGTGAAENSSLAGVSCGGGQCEAAGSYNDTSGKSRALLERLSGAWTASEGPQPIDAAPEAGQNSNLSAVSCTFDGCAAVGSYATGAGGQRPLINTVSPAGVASGTAGALPSDAATGASTNGTLSAVSCLSLEQCTAVGQYHNSSGNSIALIDAAVAGAWANVVAPLPLSAASGSSASSFLDTVSCSSRGACAAAGTFTDTGTHAQGLLQSYTPPEGYWSDASDGGIFTYGNAVFHGSMGGQHLNAPMVGMAQTPGPGGYWLVAADGGIFSFGNAVFHGSTGSLRLNAPIVGMAATPDGGGYWLVATDGGIFNYGDAGFYGSAGAIRLNKPIVGMAATPDGRGYWLVASDGGIFTYGDANFYGSRGGQPLNKPIVGMAADATGLGYWLVASDGGIFTYGDANFHGSTGSIPLNKPIVGMMSSFDGAGYWLVASDGGIFSYGDTGFEGSAGSLHLNAPVVGGTPT